MAFDLLEVLQSVSLADVHDLSLLLQKLFIVPFNHFFGGRGLVCGIVDSCKVLDFWTHILPFLRNFLEILHCYVAGLMYPMNIIFWQLLKSMSHNMTGYILSHYCFCTCLQYHRHVPFSREDNIFKFNMVLNILERITKLQSVKIISIN